MNNTPMINGMMP